MALQRALGLFKSLGHLKPSWMEIFLTPTLVLRPDTWSAGRPGSLHIEVCNLPQDDINLDPCQPALYETYNFVGVTCSIEHASLRVPAQLDIYTMQIQTTKLGNETSD